MDNSFSYNSKADGFQNDNISKEMKSSKPKTASQPRKRNGKISQNNKKLTKNITGEEFRMNKWTTSCYFF